MPLEVVVELQIRAVREVDDSPHLALNQTLSPGFLHGRDHLNHLLTAHIIIFWDRSDLCVPKISTLVFPDFFTEIKIQPNLFQRFPHSQDMFVSFVKFSVILN